VDCKYRKKKAPALQQMLLQNRFLSGFLIPEDFCGLKQVLRGYANQYRYDNAIMKVRNPIAINATFALSFK
jgi:hypothetical protein